MILVVCQKKFMRLISTCSPDQWSVYLDYLNSVFHIMNDDVGRNNYPEDVDGTVVEARKFILSQQEANPKARGPFLAEMELCCRLHARRDEGAEEGKLEPTMCCNS